MLVPCRGIDCVHTCPSVQGTGPSTSTCSPVVGRKPVYDVLQKIIDLLDAQPGLINDPSSSSSSQELTGLGDDHGHDSSDACQDHEDELVRGLEATGIAAAASAKLQEATDMEYQARLVPVHLSLRCLNSVSGSADMGCAII